MYNKDRTTLLSILIYGNYFIIGIAILLVILLVLSSKQGVFALLFVYILYYMNRKLSTYNNIGRYFYLIVNIFDLFLRLLSVEFIPILWPIFVIYVLGFHKETKKLFKESSLKRSTKPLINVNAIHLGK